MLTVIGSSLYMAPEMLSGGGYDERVDLWSLGVTIYKLVTGSTPFESEYHSNTVTAIQKLLFTFDKKKWSKYTPYLKNFVQLLLKRV